MASFWCLRNSPGRCVGKDEIYPYSPWEQLRGIWVRTYCIRVSYGVRGSSPMADRPAHRQFHPAGVRFSSPGPAASHSGFYLGYTRTSANGQLPNCPCQRYGASLRCPHHLHFCLSSPLSFSLTMTIDFAPVLISNSSAMRKHTRPVTPADISLLMQLCMVRSVDL